MPGITALISCRLDAFFWLQSGRGRAVIRVADRKITASSSTNAGCKTNTAGSASCAVPPKVKRLCLLVQRMDKQGADAEQVDMHLFYNYDNL